MHNILLAYWPHHFADPRPPRDPPRSATSPRQGFRHRALSFVTFSCCFVARRQLLNLLLRQFDSPAAQSLGLPCTNTPLSFVLGRSWDYPARRARRCRKPLTSQMASCRSPKSGEWPSRIAKPLFPKGDVATRSQCRAATHSIGLSTRSENRRSRGACRAPQRPFLGAGPRRPPGFDPVL